MRAQARPAPPTGRSGSTRRSTTCVDTAETAGVYFGTRSGAVYASRDEGEHWRPVVENLPDVLSVRALVV